MSMSCRTQHPRMDRSLCFGRSSRWFECRSFRHRPASPESRARARVQPAELDICRCYDQPSVILFRDDLSARICRCSVVRMGSRCAACRHVADNTDHSSIGADGSHLLRARSKDVVRLDFETQRLGLLRRIYQTDYIDTRDVLRSAYLATGPI